MLIFLGQKKQVTVYKIIVEGTVEASVVKQQESKGYLQSALDFDSQETGWKIDKMKELFQAGIFF